MVEFKDQSFQKYLPKNLSYEGNTYHSKYYNSTLALRSTRQRMAESAERTKIATTAASCQGEKAGAIGSSVQSGKQTGIGESLKTMTSLDVETAEEDSESRLSISGLSDSDVFSDDYTQMTDVGEGSDLEFRTPIQSGSEADSTYNSESSSTASFVENEEPDTSCFSAAAKTKLNLLLDPPPEKMNDQILPINPVKNPSEYNDLESDAGGADAHFFEDREFDFLKVEPVRRSSSLKTYKTPPGTPSRKKAVRFADALGLDLESVRHILNLEDPPNIPQSATKDLQVGVEEEHRREGNRYLTACFSQPGAVPDFFKRVQTEKVALENCLVNDRDLTVTGTVRVANISFHKTLFVRFTVNNWLTYEDIRANYVQDSCDGCTDRFCFTIAVPQYFGVGSRLEFSLMYSVDGNAYWDNNHGNNYVVECFARSFPTHDSDSSWVHFL